MKKINFNSELEFGMEKYLELLHEIDWNELKRSSNKIIMVDLTFGGISNLEEKFNIEQLMNIESFILNVSHPKTTIGSLNHCKIIEKIMVQNNNLIILVESYGFNSHSDKLE